MAVTRQMCEEAVAQFIEESTGILPSYKRRAIANALVMMRTSQQGSNSRMKKTPEEANTVRDVSNMFTKGFATSALRDNIHFSSVTGEKNYQTKTEVENADREHGENKEVLQHLSTGAKRLKRHGPHGGLAQLVTSQAAEHEEKKKTLGTKVNLFLDRFLNK